MSDQTVDFVSKIQIFRDRNKIKIQFPKRLETKKINIFYQIFNYIFMPNLYEIKVWHQEFEFRKSMLKIKIS